MSLAINLREKKKEVWHPGDAVCGSIKLILHDQLTVDRVEVALQGEARVGDISRYTDGSNKFPIFRKIAVIFSGPYKLAQTQEWPFTLHFPEYHDRSMLAGYRLKKDSEGAPNDERSHPLPPTMFGGSNTTGMAPGLLFNNAVITIKYWLSAKVIVKGALEQDLETDLPLRLIPYRDDSMLTPIPKRIEVARQRHVQSLHLDPRIGNRDLDWREKLKATFSNDLPAVSYELVADFPDQGILGEAPCILLSVRRLKPRVEAELPPVELKSFSLHLIRKAGYITGGGRLDPNREDHIRSWREESEIARWSGSKAINDKIDLRDLYRQRPLDWLKVSPDFQALNLYETHTLMLKLELEVARYNSKVTLPGPPFKVLSRYSRPERASSETSEHLEKPAEADAMEGDPELPSYEEQLRE